MNMMNFRWAGGLHKGPGWQAAHQGGPAGCEKPAGPPFCADRWLGPLSYVQPSKIHIFHLETQPSSRPSK